MARRSHATAVGWIACDGLDELGAGQKEGWLTDAPLLAALHSHHLALAHPSLVFLLGWEEYRGPAEAGGQVRIRPSLPPPEGEITAVEWIAVDDLLALALGTSGGYLLLYSTEADLIHKQIVHTGRVLRLRFREIEDSPFSNTLSYELCVVMPGAIARFDGSDIKSLLQRWFDGTRSRPGEGKRREEGEVDSYGRIPYQVWNVSKLGMCADAAITGIMPPPLLELPSRERYYCAVTIGDDAVISAYRLSEDRSRSLVGTILSKVVPATFSTIASFSKMIWRSEQVQSKKPEVKPQPFAKV
uniref:Rab3 GTPase-activating protein non-catalytic subunit n=1 Tax=Anthurium amnicola TaxID=1678845 RepID=A0A1D1YGT3_9ARAE